MEESRPPSMTAIDRIADGSGLQMAKAAVPYFPPSLQKGISLYIKIMELQNIMSYYQNPVHACAASDHADPEEILQTLKPYANDSQQQSLEQLLNVFQTLKMYQMYQDLL